MNAAHLFDGPAAHLVAKAMARGNRDAEHEAVTTLDPSPTDTVVAIGVGPGVGVELLAGRVDRVVAVDPSRVMVVETTRRNRRSVESGRVEVVRTDAAALPLADEEADGAVAVNCVQLWDPLDASLAEVARVLRADARLVAFTHDWAVERSTGRSPDAWAEWVAELAEPVGLIDLQTWRGEAEGGRSVALTLDQGATMTGDRTVIIGGGQAGLATARCLQRQGIEPVVLDASARIGDGWRRRYDSLVLFTPAQYDGLPDLAFPAPPDTYPTKDQVADYLESYASRFSIDVRSATRVEQLSRAGTNGRFLVETDREAVEASTVVVATGSLQHPRTPVVAEQLSSEILQMHSSEYRNHADVSGNRVLVVGAGNSGGQIAEELTDHATTTISYDRLPKRFPQRLAGRDIFWWFQRWGVMDRTREAAGSSEDAVGAVPLIGTRIPKLVRTGRLRRVARVVGADGRDIQLADGSTTRPDTVIWATGYRNDFTWIDIPDAITPDGAPNHERGISTTVEGLAFIGLPGLHTKGSAFLGFVGRDAQHLATELSVRLS